MTPRVVLITDPRYDDQTLLRVADAVCTAVRGACVQARRTPGVVAKLREITRARGGILMVNRDLALAREVVADGVHVDVANVETAGFALVSAPAHDDEEAANGARAGASFVLVSPIHGSPGKALPRGLDAIRSARRVVGATVGVVALGGVDAENARACLEAGADGVACIRALLEADDPAATALRMVGHVL